MLTKRESDDQKIVGEEEKYQHVIQKLKDILGKYEKKVTQLREQRDNYRIKLKHEMKKRL